MKTFIKYILIIMLFALGGYLIYFGVSCAISFNNTQDEIVEAIEENEGEEVEIDVPQKAIEEYKKASEKDPELYPKIEDEYITKKAKVICILEIESIGLRTGVIEGITPSELAISAGYYPTSSKPNKEEGNFVVAGHVSGPVPVFAKLKKVNIGDEVKVKYKNEIYKYKITDSFIADPTQIDILDSTPGEKNITIFTCTNKGKQRLVVRGEAID